MAIYLPCGQQEPPIAKWTWRQYSGAGLFRAVSIRPAPRRLSPDLKDYCRCEHVGLSID